ncbi:MAG: NUDIX hydrolase [Desulfatiglans sp.]|jgi:ADP-ribose pyrophosphatase YjhB (NUDIX family)|nr:NUDIX hydrolase [Thermodesulfobacteriota bacterium]MEE4351875.1 NUDIX hydrolase [Desulfatiglans sp.]
MKDRLFCPHCGGMVEKYKNPFPTVDIIIEMEPSFGAHSMPNSRQGIVLITRKNTPLGWALPGGFVDYGESLESAALREAEEETSLKVSLLYQLGAYSDPTRDPRYHTISVVFVASAKGEPRAADDAESVGIFYPDSLPDELAFDHSKILQDYFKRCLP